MKENKRKVLTTVDVFFSFKGSGCVNFNSSLTYNNLANFASLNEVFDVSG